jgi:hypothetical protein
MYVKFYFIEELGNTSYFVEIIFIGFNSERIREINKRNSKTETPELLKKESEFYHINL